jgi:hypothetical protein
MLEAEAQRATNVSSLSIRVYSSTAHRCSMLGVVCHGSDFQQPQFRLSDQKLQSLPGEHIERYGAEAVIPLHLGAQLIGLGLHLIRVSVRNRTVVRYRTIAASVVAGSRRKMRHRQRH